MKFSLSLIGLYICCLYVIDIYSDNKPQYFRRFELLVTGLRHANYFFEGTYTCCLVPDPSNKCANPCDRSPSIIINDMAPLTFPPIGSSHEPADGDFLYNNVWEDYDEPRVFRDFLNVSISVIKTNTNSFLGTGTLENLRFAPNTDKQWRNFPLGLNIMVNIHMSYWCYGYTGMNCEYPCTEDDPSVECDYKTGAVNCVNGNPNPYDCSSTSDACLKYECQNLAICHMTSYGYTYCECRPGFVGKRCEFPICESPCDPDYGQCVNGKCQCTVGWEGKNCSTATCNGWNMCQNNGECIIKSNEHLCNCNPLKFAGQFCEKSCLVDCIFGTCFYDGKISSCVCFEGYIGEGCNTIPDPQPSIFESGYVPKYKQTAIIVGVIVALVIIAIFTFGFGSYVRKNITRNIKIVKRAEYVVNTLKRETLMDPTLNTTLIGNQTILKN